MAHVKNDDFLNCQLSGRIKGKKIGFFPFKSHFSSSCTVKNSLTRALSLFKMAFLGSVAYTSKHRPEAHAPALHSEGFVHSLSNPNHQTGHRFPLLPKPLFRKKRRKNTHKTPGERSCPVLTVCGNERPAPAFRARRRVCSRTQIRRARAGSAFSETISPAAAHYLWQLFLDLKWVLKPCCQLPSCHPTIL